MNVGLWTVCDKMIESNAVPGLHRQCLGCCVERGFVWAQQHGATREQGVFGAFGKLGFVVGINVIGRRRAHPAKMFDIEVGADVPKIRCFGHRPDGVLPN